MSSSERHKLEMKIPEAESSSAIVFEKCSKGKRWFLVDGGGDKICSSRLFPSIISARRDIFLSYTMMAVATRNLYENLERDVTIEVEEEKTGAFQWRLQSSGETLLCSGNTFTNTKGAIYDALRTNVELTILTNRIMQDSLQKNPATHARRRSQKRPHISSR